MSLRAVIVDDEPVARRRLRTLLRAEPEVEVVEECSDGEQAVAAVRRHRPDLMFLDVQMPGMDGFEVVEALGIDCPATLFVTAYDRYALKAFEVHAVDYLLKPFDRARLRRALAHVRALDRSGPEGSQSLHELAASVAASRPLRRIVVRGGGRVVFVRTDEVDWIEATGHYLRLHVGRESHLVRETMAALESRLDPGRFARIHRSTIVNLERVKEMRSSFHGEYEVALRDGTRLQCSRGYAQRLQRALEG